MTGIHKPMDESDIAFITLVKQTPSLYNPRNSGYRSPSRKEHDWSVVAARAGFTTTEAKRRWTCLRDRYSRDLRLLRRYPERKELGHSEFFKLMNFLQGFIRERRERRRKIFKFDNNWDAETQNSEVTKVNCSNVHDEELIEEDQHAIVDGINSFSHKKPMPIGDCNVYAECQEALFMADSGQTFEEFIETHSSNDNPHTVVQLNPQSLLNCINEKDPLAKPSKPESKEAEDDYFCLSVAAYLKQLSRTHKIKAKVEMFQILEKYIELEERLSKRE